MELLYFSGVIVGGFLAFVLFTKSDKTVKDYMLACWLATAAIMLFSVYLLVSGHYSSYPIVAIQGLWMPLAQGPFLYLYIKYQTRPLLFQKRDLLHFLPFILGYLLFCQFYWLPLTAKLNIIENNAAGFETENRIRAILIYLSGVIYIPLSGYKLLIFRKGLQHQFSNVDKINFRWLLYLIIGMAVIWIAVLVIHSDQLVFSASAIFVGSMGYFGVKQVNVFSQKIIEHMAFAADQAKSTEDENLDEHRNEGIVVQAAPTKYARSPLDEEGLQRLHIKLLSVLEEEKPYLDPELTLNGLAEMLPTNPNLLSQVINSVEQKTFYELINEYRVKEFIQQVALPVNKKYTLLTIAYDCGFNSKASFHRNFKKTTGKTPGEYLDTIS